MQAGRSAQGEWRRNWPVVLAGAIGGSLATIHLYSTGVMIAPLAREFGWTRTQVSSGLTIVSLVSVLLAPLIGVLVDRIGPRIVALFGVAVFSVAVASLSQVTGIAGWWALWSVIAVGGACIAPTIWAAGVTSLFVKARGLALAITLCGTSIGAVVVPLTTQLLVDGVGWRGAYPGLAAIWAAITLPVVYFGFSSAIDRQVGRSRAAAARPRGAEQEPSALQAIASLRYAKLALAAILIVTVSSSILANVVPILTDQGYPAAAAAAVAGLIGLGSLSGRLCGGLLLDRVDARLVASLSVLMPIATCLIVLMAPGSATAVAVGLFTLGLAVGIEWDAVAYLTSRHFAIRQFGTLFGTIGGLSLLLNGVGPVVTNYIFDVTGSYRPALWAFIPLCVLSSALFFLLGPCPAKREDDSAIEPDARPALSA